MDFSESEVSGDGLGGKARQADSTRSEYPEDTRIEEGNRAQVD